MTILLSALMHPAGAAIAVLLIIWTLSDWWELCGDT